MCVQNSSIVRVTENGTEIMYGGGGWEFNVDTNMIWIKFDHGFEDYENRIVCITFDKGYAKVEAQYIVKGGQIEDGGLTFGPGCPEFVIPEFPLGTIGTIGSMGLAAVIFSLRKRLAN
jgi:hypothetical protein